MTKTHRGRVLAILLAFAFLLECENFLLLVQPVAAFGLVPVVPGARTQTPLVPRAKRRSPRRLKAARRHSVFKGGRFGRAVRVPVKASAGHRRRSWAEPQALIGSLATRTVAPGVIHRFYRGALGINVVDIDMLRSQAKVRPVLAGDAFNQPARVEEHARQTRACAAVNANYFKKNGTPLGALMIDGEWIAGPIYNRVCLGITGGGYVRIDNLHLYGTLETSSARTGRLWVANINQPRRSGSRLIVYTRRWGSFVRMPYAGALVAVDSTGRVVDKSTTVMAIPYGGYVLSDRKNSALANLMRGDLVNLTWHMQPDSWANIVHAISGGPVLVRDGKLFVNLKGERFHRGWTGSHITARTAAGVTADNHLLLVTIEGGHTLWDLAKFMHKLGAVEALNLDGGGSTTMVVEGKVVTKNKHSYQRRVPSSLVVMAAAYGSGGRCRYIPKTDLTDFCPALTVPVLLYSCDLALPEELAGLTRISQSSLAPAPLSKSLPPEELTLVRMLSFPVE